jgi:hypothetical protein
LKAKRRNEARKVLFDLFGDMGGWPPNSVNSAEFLGHEGASAAFSFQELDSQSFAGMCLPWRRR